MQQDRSVNTGGPGRRAGSHSAAGHDKTDPQAGQQHKADTKTEAALKECLDLLKGPTDERRFVGLLLVTKLLPAGNEDTIRAVYGAVGPQFISRLLLPLRQSQVAFTEQSRHKDISACVLALALLASSCRLNAIAAAEEVVEKVPLFVKVIRNGGVSCLLNAPQAPTQAEDWRRTDEQAVEDALECLLAVAAASPEGHTVCVESGAVAAACSALQARDGKAGARDALALHLLGILLERADQRGALAESASEISAVVPAVASFMVLDEQAASAASPSVKGKQPEGAPAPAPDMLDPAALQLQALYVLLLILSSPPPQLERCLEESVRSGAKSGRGWPAQARSGIATLLRGRLAPAQRQTALQVAACILGLAGADWLLAPSYDRRDMPEEFFQLLVEVVKVEALVTLRDALAPAERIPLPREFVPAPGRSSTGADAGGEASTSAAMEQDSDDDDGQGFPTMMPPLERPAPLVDEHGKDIEPEGSKDQSNAPGRQGTDTKPSAANGHTELAGERAARVLPAVFALAEGCVEALAAHSQRAEAAADISSADDDETPPPVLSDRVAMRAMSSLQEAHEAILQYLEAAAQGEVGTDDPIILAAIRSLGRFLAEAPDAFGERMRKLLPFLLTVHQGQATAFLLPALSQVVPSTSEPQPSSASSSSAWLAALLDRQVLEALSGYTAQIANDARELWSAAMQRASPAAWAALASAEAMLLPALQLLRALQNGARAEDYMQQMALAAQALLASVPVLASWARERSRASPAPALGTPPAGPDGIDCRLLVIAGGLAASTLLAAVQQGEASCQPLQEHTSAGAALVSRAIDEGFVRLAVAKRKAVERAQEQLRATSISSGAQQSPSPPGSGAEDWLDEIRDEWTEVVRITTQLALESAHFAAELRKLKPLWREDGGVHSWADVASELHDLRQAVVKNA